VRDIKIVGYINEACDLKI